MKKLLANLYIQIKNVTDTSTVLVAHAWGVLPKTISRIVRRMVESTDLSVARKVRADAGKTTFNSDAKRKSIYTPRFCFLQKKRRENPGEHLTTESWRRVDKTLCEFVMGLPDSWYKSTRIFPLLDKQSTERRYNWAKAFWIKSFGALLRTATTTYRLRRLPGHILATTRW
jgi:hypothetical protein